MYRFAPEGWIHELNRLFPNLWTDLRKALENPKRFMNDDCVKFIGDVPSWCPMPTFFPYLTLARRLGPDVYLRYRDAVMTVASMYLWRAGKGIYRFSPELYRALVNQPFSGDIPNECLYRMPEWAVYIETPGITIGGLPVSGFIAHLDYNLYSRETDLQFAIFRQGISEPKMIALPLGEGGLTEAMHRVDAIDSIDNMAWGMVFLTHAQDGLSGISRRSWLFLILSGLATGASWLCYYRALQMGEVSKVVPIDKLSVLITLALAFIFLHEQFTVKSLVGCLLIGAGTLVMVL